MVLHLPPNVNRHRAVFPRPVGKTSDVASFCFEGAEVKVEQKLHQLCQPDSLVVRHKVEDSISDFFFLPDGHGVETPGLGAHRDIFPVGVREILCMLGGWSAHCKRGSYKPLPRYQCHLPGVPSETVSSSLTKRAAPPSSGKTRPFTCLRTAGRYFRVTPLRLAGGSP